MLKKYGDILLFKPAENDLVGSGISGVTSGEYCHCAIYVGNGYIIEAINTKGKSGVIKRLLTKEDSNLYAVFYMPYLNNKEILKIVDWCHKQIGLEYDTLGLIPSFFHSVIGMLFNSKQYKNQKPLFNDPNKYFCSELIATGFYITLGFEICYEIHHSTATPNDLGRRSLLLKRKQ